MQKLIPELINGVPRTKKNQLYYYYYYYYYYTIIVSFMQGIHTHIPETNHVPRGYIVAAILSLLFMVPLFLVPAVAVLFFLFLLLLLLLLFNI